MWKLLNDRDRTAIRAAEKEPHNEMGPQLVIITTPGHGGYSCANCYHYGHEGNANTPTMCAARGIPPDAMPCTFSPKRPEMYFQPVVNVQPTLGKLDLEHALLLSVALPRKIGELVQQEALKLPYRVGEMVSFIHEQTFVTGEVAGFDETFVNVLFAGDELMLPHSTVIPAKRIKPDQPKDLTAPDSLT